MNEPLILPEKYQEDRFFIYPHVEKDDEYVNTISVEDHGALTKALKNWLN